uniref:Uncharacterized protein n=1 Tax=Oryza glumipatula TaxID=40148 RepID=A0A0E0BSY7_9ORYZ
MGVDNGGCHLTEVGGRLGVAIATSQRGTTNVEMNLSNNLSASLIAIIKYLSSLNVTLGDTNNTLITNH